MAYFIAHNDVQVHPCCKSCNDRISFLWLINTPSYICTTFLYPFISGWTLSLFPCLVYCSQCCNKHGSADVSDRLISFPMDIHPAEGSLDHTGSYGSSVLAVHNGCTHLHSPPTICKGSLFPIFCLDSRQYHWTAVPLHLLF